MKGFFQGIKYFTQIFAYKDQEMVIGLPTEVRHVGHISGDGFSSMDWVNDLKMSCELSSENSSSRWQSRETSWASHDFDQCKDNQTNMETPEIRKARKKTKKKTTKSTSSSSLGSISSGRPPKVAPSCANSMQGTQRNEETKYVNVKVA